jgi:hypothetical protein
VQHPRILVTMTTQNLACMFLCCLPPPHPLYLLPAHSVCGLFMPQLPILVKNTTGIILWHIRIPWQRNNENNSVPITMKQSLLAQQCKRKACLWIRCDSEGRVFKSTS